MQKKRNYQAAGTFRVLTFVLLTVYFVGIALVDGPVWCVDSPSYTSMDFSREPVYPLFLLGLRSLFEVLGLTGQLYDLPSYLTAAVILQSMLWVFAIWYLANFIVDITHRELGEKRSILLGTMAILSQVAVTVLNRFIANRGSMYSECIMTESLAMPLYVIFIVVLVKSFDGDYTKSLIKLFFLGTLISSIRKQMLIVIMTWGFASFIIHLFVKKHRSLKNFSLTFIAALLSLMTITLFDYSYNLVVRGVFTGHILNSKGGLDTLLYTALPEDEALFADADEEEFPDMRALFTKIYDECTARQLTIDYAPGYELKEKSGIFNSDWPAMASHYADSYDVIGFEVVLPICDEYVEKNFPELDRVHAQMKENQVENLLFGTLLKNTLSNIVSGRDRGAIYVFTANVLKAFVISNANISPSILIAVSLVIYVVYLAVFIGLFIRKKSSLRDISKRLMFIVMAGIAINCVVTGSMIFPQPRYMCYGMGLFYLSLLCGISVSEVKMAKS